MEVREEYKQTEIGILPIDWTIKSLGEITEITMGQSPKSQFYNTTGIGLPLIQGNADIVKRKTIIRNYTSETTKKGKKGSVIMTVRAPVGEVSKTDFDCCLGRGVCSIIVKNDYYYQYLIYIEKDWASLSTGSTFDSVNSNQLKTVKIPLPTLPEQQAIAEVLSDTDNLIQSVEKQIAKKRNIKQGVMQKLLSPKEGWANKKLGEIANVTMGQSPLSEYYNSEGIGLPLIQGNADIENRKTIIRFYTSSITKKGKTGDIIMSVRAPVGEISKATFDCCLGRGVCSISFGNEYLYHYLIYFEKSWTKLSTGSTFDSVNSKQVKELEIPLPDPKEQLKIATIFSDMDSEINVLESKLSKYNYLKQGLMQNLLTGKIRLIYS